jgi:glucosamine--fructose-6-phosphate aminotransferase (isomerizing)
MCGIVCYVGKNEAKPILVEGLKRLEYRGYDSAGIAVRNGDNVYLWRSVGKISELERKINGQVLSGQCGIAHTRWATHGEPTETNAHPHRDQDENASHPQRHYRKFPSLKKSSKKMVPLDLRQTRGFLPT